MNLKFIVNIVCHCWMCRDMNISNFLSLFHTKATIFTSFQFLHKRRFFFVVQACLALQNSHFVVCLFVMHQSYACLHHFLSFSSFHSFVVFAFLIRFKMFDFHMASSDGVKRQTNTKEQTNKQKCNYPRGNIHGFMVRLSDIINNSCNGITIALNEIQISSICIAIARVFVCVLFSGLTCSCCEYILYVCVCASYEFIGIFPRITIFMSFERDK